VACRGAARWRVARLDQIVFDSEHPASLARFWSAALDGFEIRPYDDTEVRRLAALGLTPESDPIVIVDGPMVELCCQRVDASRSTKNPVHLDIASAERDAEVARLVALGASMKERFAAHTWMHDPEGNDFCITDR